MRTLKGKFTKWHNVHPNPMTPELVEKHQIGDDKIIEVTKSRRKEFYGISVWQNTGEVCEYCNEEREEHNRFEAVNYDLNQSFHDEDEAMEYMQLLKNKFRNYEEISDIVEKVNRQKEDGGE